MKSYKCPHCGKEQTKVNVYYEHYQNVNLETGSVDSRETIFDAMTDAECPECSKSIRDFVEDEENEKLNEIIMNAI